MSSHDRHRRVGGPRGSSLLRATVGRHGAGGERDGAVDVHVEPLEYDALENVRGGRGEEAGMLSRT